MNAFERIRETTIVERLRLAYGSVIDIIKVDGSKRTINSQNLLGVVYDAFGNVIGLMSPSGGTIPIAGISAEAMGASPSATAAVNTAAIQTALNRTGLVTLTTPGTYSINGPLFVKSNTHIRLGEGVTIQQSAHSAATTLISSVTVAGGIATAINISSNPTGAWTVAPRVIFTGGGMRPAILRAVMGSGGTAGQIASVTIVDGGNGYGVAPTVEVMLPTESGGTTAVLTPVITAGRVTSVTVTNAGAGYLTIGGGSIAVPLRVRGAFGPQATATLAANGSISGFTITNGGGNLNVASHPYDTGVKAQLIGSTVMGMPMLLNDDFDNGNDNITVEGGAWDYNYTNQTGVVTGLYQMDMVFCNVENLKLYDFSSINGNKYNILTGATRGLRTRNLRFVSRADGLHNQGPMIDALIDGTHGMNGEGVVTINSADIANYSISEGLISGVLVRNTTCLEGPTPVSLFPDWDVVAVASFPFEDVVIDGIVGYNTTQAVQVQPDTATTIINKLTLKNIGVKTTTQGTGVVNITKIEIKHLEIDGFEHSAIAGTGSDNGAAVFINSTAIVDLLTIRGLTSLSGYDRKLIFASGDLYELDVFAADVLMTNLNGGTMLALFSKNTIRRIGLHGGRYEAANRLIQCEIAGAVGSVTLNGVGAKSVTRLLDLRGTWEVSVNGGYFDASTLICGFTTDCQIGLSGGGWTLANGALLYEVQAAPPKYIPRSPQSISDLGAAHIFGAAGGLGYNSSATTLQGIGPYAYSSGAWRRTTTLGQTVSSSATPALNCNLGNVVAFTATAASTWGAPTNIPPAGTTVTITITQDGTGGWNISWNAAYIFPTAWTNVGNTAGLISEATFVSNGTKLVAQGANVWHA